MHIRHDGKLILVHLKMYIKRLFQHLAIAVVTIHTILAKDNDLDDFICTDGNKIDLNNICNGAVDCTDGSDETKELCYHVICPKDTFRCHYGACVHQVKRCNGKSECADKSDESQCGRAAGSCEKNEFKCDSGQCIHVDQMCDGKEHCAYGSDENKSTCEELPCPEKTFRCKHGGCVHLDARCNGILDCIDGSDESEMLCKNLQCKGATCSKLRNKVHCPAIDISRIDAICQSATGVVPCDNPVPAGTTVEYECKPHFVPVDGKHKHNRRASCQMDGAWNRKVLQCEPKCGDIGPEAVALVVNGWDTGKKLYPWHATMYVEEEGKWEFWCGGTLITEKAVLTAGHCIWKLLPENIKVAFGKYYTDFHKRQHSTQIRNIQRVITQPLYQDRTGNYGSDLAVLVLSDPVKLSSEIHPACIDWNLRDTIYHFKNNSIGLAVGMGITENDTFSETLKGVYLPVVSNEKCVEDQEEDFKKYITYTVFCAGWKNGTAVCNGDSGGGLVFPKVSDKSKWILQGVVSVSPRKKGTSFCNPQFYTVFTKISLYLNWLKETLKSIHHQYYG